MELANLPLWAQQLGGLLLTIATAIGLTWSERRKRKEEPAPPSGDAQIVAASFVEKRQMEDLIYAVKANTAAMNELREPIEKIYDRLHEEELVRAAAARIREGRG